MISRNVKVNNHILVNAISTSASKHHSYVFFHGSVFLEVLFGLWGRGEIINQLINYIPPIHPIDGGLPIGRSSGLTIQKHLFEQ